MAELDSYGGAISITDVIHWAADLGMKVADCENEGDSRHAQELRKTFNLRLSEMPRNALGGFHIFGEAAIQAYTQGYLRNTNASR